MDEIENKVGYIRVIESNDGDDEMNVFDLL